MKNKNKTIAGLILTLILALCIIGMVALALGCKVSQRNTLPVISSKPKKDTPLAEAGKETAITDPWTLAGTSAGSITFPGSTSGSTSIAAIGHWDLAGASRDTIPIGKLDTVAVLMLFSSGCREDGLDRRAAYAAWGYSVRIRRKYQDPPDGYCPNCQNYWEHTGYLDAFKNKLKDCITVWMSK